MVVGVSNPGGRAIVARLEADGSPDAGFGSYGTVTTGFGGSGGDAEAVVVQTDGKIVVAGDAAPTISGLRASTRTVLSIRFSAPTA